MIGITLNPVLGVEPWKDLLKESVRVALGDTKLSDPDWLVEGLVEVDQVVLEILGLVPRIVMGNDEIDLAVAAACHELFQVVDALVWLIAISHCWGADPEALCGQRLDVLLVSCNGFSNGNVAATTTEV